MPNGKCYRPYRMPGKYCCIVCRDLKDAEEFYKDCTRYNGCGSRCKKCDNLKREARRNSVNQRFAPSAKSLDTPSTQTDNSWSRRQIKKRIDEIKSDLQPVGPTVYRRAVKKDTQGRPVWIEKTTHHPNGDMEVTFEKVQT